MKLVTIQKVRHAGKHGGGVFRGITGKLTEHRFVANPTVMPRPPVEGEVWLIEGVIRRHPEYGPQVEIDWMKLEKPSGKLIIHTIANSRCFPGIGKATATKLWQEFGDRLYKLLDQGDAQAFVDHIGPDLSEVIVDGWKTLSATSDIYAWLDEHGIPVRLAHDLMAVYPANLIAQLEENPYRILAFTNWDKGSEKNNLAFYPSQI